MAATHPSESSESPNTRFTLRNPLCALCTRPNVIRAWYKKAMHLAMTWAILASKLPSTIPDNPTALDSYPTARRKLPSRHAEAFKSPFRPLSPRGFLKGKSRPAMGPFDTAIDPDVSCDELHRRRRSPSRVVSQQSPHENRPRLVGSADTTWSRLWSEALSDGITQGYWSHSSSSSNEPPDEDRPDQDSFHESLQEPQPESDGTSTAGSTMGRMFAGMTSLSSWMWRKPASQVPAAAEGAAPGPKVASVGGIRESSNASVMSDETVRGSSDAYIPANELLQGYGRDVPRGIQDLMKVLRCRSYSRADAIVPNLEKSLMYLKDCDRSFAEFTPDWITSAVRDSISSLERMIETTRSLDDELAGLSERACDVATHARNDLLAIDDGCGEAPEDRPMTATRIINRLAVAAEMLLKLTRDARETADKAHAHICPLGLGHHAPGSRHAVARDWLRLHHSAACPTDSTDGGSAFGRTQVAARLGWRALDSLDAGTGRLSDTRRALGCLEEWSKLRWQCLQNVRESNDVTFQEQQKTIKTAIRHLRVAFPNVSTGLGDRALALLKLDTDKRHA